MDALKQQLLKVQQQLAGLSASQKMLTAALLVIMVMTLFYWSRFAGASDMEAVMDKPLTGEELANVRAAVAEQGIESELRDGRVYVPASKRPLVTQALSKLATAGKLPAGLADPAPADNAASSFFSSASDRAERRLDKAGRVAESILRGWPGVTAARVVFNGEKRGSVLGAELPTASVSITCEAKPSEFKRLADSARVNVSHMLSGLKPEGVGITINGKSYKYAEDDGYGGDDGVLAARKEIERYFSDQVISRLNHIANLQVTVRVKMQTSTTEMSEYKVDPKNKVSAPRRETSTTETNTQPAIGGEAGTVPNVGIAEGASPAVGTTSSVEKTENENVGAIGYQDVRTKTPAGNSEPQAASIGVPVSYYRRVWRQYNPAATAEPSMTDLEPIIAKQSASIRESVKTALTIADDKSVAVDTYFDEPPKTPEVVTAGLAALPAASSFGPKEIAIGALAVISLLMVSMMVKKSAPQPQLAVVGADAAGPVPEDTGASLLSVRDLAGEVHEADLTMTGQELSEEAIEARQVIEQVGTMVKQNPEVAANLVKRWLNQD